jgi:hypothetical protein
MFSFWGRSKQSKDHAQGRICVSSQGKQIAAQRLCAWPVFFAEPDQDFAIGEGGIHRLELISQFLARPRGKSDNNGYRPFGEAKGRELGKPAPQIAWLGSAGWHPDSPSVPGPSSGVWNRRADPTDAIQKLLKC